METPQRPLSLLERAAAERERWALWTPVVFGSGIALYFALPAEPWIGSGSVAACVLAAIAWMRRSSPWAWLFAVLALAAAGTAAAQWRSAWQAAPVLDRPSGKIVVAGRVVEVEPMPDGGSRLTLVDLDMDLDGPKPTKIRLRLKDRMSVPVGARIRMHALLMPPAPPAMPGAFDFARHAWFQGLGAVGSGLGRPEILSQPDGFQGMNALREIVMRRVLAVLPPQTGGVAAALITGETSAVPGAIIQSYRDSGLAHLLAISGLHMGLMAGLAFFVVRGGLALVPAIALRRPIKKWAAAAALVGAFAYLMLAGAPIPAQRAFVMTGMVLIAVMLDRSALSLRLVAFAAMVVLITAPESLIGPSFQMSFAAVTALIAAYESVSPKIAAWRSQRPGISTWVVIYLFGLIFSTLIAGSSTAVYGGFHFNRFAVWSIPANMAAMPVTALIVMPSAAASMLLMPFGLEQWALIPMGWGIRIINWAAAETASWPAASLMVPPMPVWALGLFTLGGLWLCLWRGTWRFWGVPVMAAALAAPVFHQKPDLLVDGRGYSFALRSADGSLLINRGGRILRETWERRAGPNSVEKWPKQGTSEDGRLTCAKAGCRYQTDAGLVALILDETDIADACANARVVVSAVPLRRACRGPQAATDRFDLWKRGAHVYWFGSGGQRIENVAEHQGRRPWSHNPRPRKKKLDESDVED